ncbi:MAG: aminoglycoside phosphotransferase family protein [Candidatus Aegiribacteria sp.]|nr:aminoglycoside phosphotransferase family protein [Candidatus Aegiribacteria sp.]
MEDIDWHKHLRAYGIRVKRLIPIRDWSESRVIRVEGTRCGKPAISYLKWFPRGGDTELAVYNFAGQHASFPAPGATAVMVEGKEWLLLDCADGTLLADIARADTPEAYIATARRMARFHMQAIGDGWTSEMSGLGTLKVRIEALSTSVLKDLRRMVSEGKYHGVNLSLLSLVETASAQLWPELTEDFRSYPDSLIHGDCHYGNLFLTPQDGICLIDWGSASLAPGLMDLAALVDVTLRMDEQDIHEPDVLAAYFDELSQSEREAYGNRDRAWDVCRSVRAFLELEWFATTGDDYGQRVQRELTLLRAFFHI